MVIRFNLRFLLLQTIKKIKKVITLKMIKNIIYVGESCSMNHVTRLMEECDSVIYTVDFRILTMCSLVVVYHM
jgi:hypothetical protein